MRINKIIQLLFAKKYIDQRNLLSIYCIDDEEMRNILSKNQNPVLSLDFDLDEIGF